MRLGRASNEIINTRDDSRARTPCSNLSPGSEIADEDDASLWCDSDSLDTREYPTSSPARSDSFCNYQNNKQLPEATFNKVSEKSNV